MGLLDKLLGGVLPPAPRTHSQSGTSAHRPGTSRPTARPANPMRQPVNRPNAAANPMKKPMTNPAEPTAPAEKPTQEAAPVAAPAAESAPAATLTADDILAEFTEVAEKAAATEAPAEHTTGSMGSFSAAREEAVMAGEIPAETSMTAAPAAEESRPDEAETAERPWSDVTQRKLDRYFARLRNLYPDGVIVRLNTGQKKLAERGAQLRREIGMEGQLDAFFALGDLTYRRSEGGRPSVVSTEKQQQSLRARLKKHFPQGVPSVAEVQRRDHRLYLDLRAAARREQCTMTEFLKKNG